MRKFTYIMVLVLAAFSAAATEIIVNTGTDWGLLDKVIEEARSYIGTPYVYGGTSRSGVDCSGFVYIVYRDAAGLNIPRRVADLYAYGEEIGKDYLPGDLFFFDTAGGPSHVGICLGGTEFIHAASDGARTGVTIDDLNAEYYKKRFLGTRRIISGSSPLVKIILDKKSEDLVLDKHVPDNERIYFKIVSEFKDSRAVTFKAVKNNRDYLEKRIQLDPEAEPSLVWFIPVTGIWVVTLYDEEGRELAVFHFQSGEIS